SNETCVAVSEYTKEIIIHAAAEIDDQHGTQFAPQCAERIGISYPAIDACQYTNLDDGAIAKALAARGLERDRYVLFLSRLSKAKGVDDLISGFARSHSRNHTKLVVAGNGPEAVALRAHATSSLAADQIVFLDDVDDTEKPLLMAGSAAFALPSKPRPEFVETFGIALVEKMLAGGGPVITCQTGGIPEAVGSNALMVPHSSPQKLAEAIDLAIGGMSAAELRTREAAARTYAMRFDRNNVFDNLFTGLTDTLAA
ncbi:MAG: glycosyltransferase, partial [Ilumatobacter fluminis]